jgi:hypothetical protein
MAIYLNEQVTSADLKSETRWATYAWFPMALAHGLQACRSTPISSAAGEVLGAFAIYYDEPRTPMLLHQSLIEHCTHVASIAIEVSQNYAALKRSEAFLAEAQHLSSTGSFSWRVATDEMTCSEELYRIFEFDQGVPVTGELMLTRLSLHLRNCSSGGAATAHRGQMMRKMKARSLADLVNMAARLRLPNVR